LKRESSPTADEEAAWAKAVSNELGNLVVFAAFDPLDEEFLSRFRRCIV